jgi:hypothetical protein
VPLRGAFFIGDSFVEPWIPARTAKPPSGPDWVDQIKHDGYRLSVRRAGSLVRPFNRPVSRDGKRRGRQGEWRGRLITTRESGEARLFAARSPTSCRKRDRRPSNARQAEPPYWCRDADKSMTTFQSIALGVMIVWTPSFLFVAISVWHAPMVRERHTSDQELSRERRSPNLQAEDTTIQPSGAGVVPDLNKT